VTATVKELSVTVARLAAQPRLTEAGRQPAASVAQNKMSPNFFFCSSVLAFSELRVASLLVCHLLPQFRWLYIKVRLFWVEPLFSIVLQFIKKLFHLSFGCSNYLFTLFIR